MRPEADMIPCLSDIESTRPVDTDWGDSVTSSGDWPFKTTVAVNSAGHRGWVSEVFDTQSWGH